MIIDRVQTIKDKNNIEMAHCQGNRKPGILGLKRWGSPFSRRLSCGWGCRM